MRWIRRSDDRATSDPVPASWRNTRFVVVDLETTGLNPRTDHIVSYGSVPIVDGRYRPADASYGLVACDRRIPGQAIRIHTIRNQDLEGAPPLGDCVRILDRQLRGAVLVAHSASIERAFLGRAFRAHGAILDCPVVDTEQLARMVLDIDSAGGQSISLEEIAGTLGLPIQHPHHALGDAFTTATLFLAVVGKLEQRGPVSTSTILAYSDARLFGN